MRPTIQMILITAALATAALPASANQADKLRILEAENKALRAQISSLEKRLATLESEVERLLAENWAMRKRLLAGATSVPGTQPATAPAGQRTATSRPAMQAADYLYQSKSRTRKWFEYRFLQFRDKIVLLDGRCYDAGRARLERPCIGKEPPAVGSLRRIKGTARVFQAINTDEAIVEITLPRVGVSGSFSGRPSGPIRWSGGETLYVHIKGVAAEKNVDGTKLPLTWLVYLGKYSYVTVAGAKATVQSFRPYRPLTREQFARALGKGFRLIWYEKIEKRIRVKGAREPVTVDEVIARPVP